MSIALLAGAIGRILLFVVVGIALRVSGLLSRGDSRPLNAVIVYVALPALIFTTVAGTTLSAGHLRAVAVAWIVTLAGVALAWAASRALRLGPRMAGALILAASFGTTAYLGYPMVRSLLGERWLAPAVFYDVFGTVSLLFTFGVAIAAREGRHEGRIDIIRELLTFPAVVAMLAGLAYRLVPWPENVTEAVMGWTGTAGTMALPLIMISLGVSLEPRSLGSAWRALSAVAAIKLLALPALAVVVALAMGDAGSSRMLALEAGMPSGMLTLVVAERFDLDSGFIAAAILATMIASLITIPLVQLIVP